MINLEQSAVSVVAHNNLSASDTKRQVKEESLRIVQIEDLTTGDPILQQFVVYLQRPYHAGCKKGEISQGIFINLHTKNSISFTKGLVLKKHLVTKEL